VTKNRVTKEIIAKSKYKIGLPHTIVWSRDKRMGKDDK